MSTRRARPTASSAASSRATLVRALEGLPADQRDARSSLTGHGLAQREIAQLTGAPLGTVKGRIRLGLRKARANLAPA